MCVDVARGRLRAGAFWPGPGNEIKTKFGEDVVNKDEIGSYTGRPGPLLFQR